MQLSATKKMLEWGYVSVKLLEQVKSQVKEDAWQLNQNISPLVVLSFTTAK